MKKSVITSGPVQAIGATINIELTTTEPSERTAGKAGGGGRFIILFTAGIQTRLTFFRQEQAGPLK